MSMDMGESVAGQTGFEKGYDRYYKAKEETERQRQLQAIKEAEANAVQRELESIMKIIKELYELHEKAPNQEQKVALCKTATKFIESLSQYKQALNNH